MMMYMTPRAANPARASHRIALLFAARRPVDQVDLAVRPALRRAVQVANPGSSPWEANAKTLPPSGGNMQEKPDEPAFLRRDYCGLAGEAVGHASHHRGHLLCYRLDYQCHRQRDLS